MDYSVFYIIIAILISFGLAYLIRYAKRKQIIKQEDFILAMNMLSLGTKIISEMRLDKEDEILKISEIVRDSLEYAISIYSTEQDIIKNATEFAYELCTVLDVELTETRKELISDLISLVFRNEYLEIR